MNRLTTPTNFKELQERFDRLGLNLKRKRFHYVILSKKKPQKELCKYRYLKTAVTELFFREAIQKAASKAEVLEKVTN